MEREVFSLTKAVQLLNEILVQDLGAKPEELARLIREFQNYIWHQSTGDMPDELGDLAYDLDYFVANEKWRAQDSSYLGPETAIDKIKSALLLISQESK